MNPSIGKSLNVYVLMPCADLDRAIAARERWTAKGYKMAFYFDIGKSWPHDDLFMCGQYNGVWDACNALAFMALEFGADVCLFAGDDMDPDPFNSAQQIAKEYLTRYPDGFGVMQPCGDMQGMDETGKPAAARICGSAWFGKGWITRAYQGKGPTDPRYWHFFGDESLYEVANKLGVLWMRPELMQFHYHWAWGWTLQQEYHRRNQLKWEEDRALFYESKALGFPEGEPLPA